MRVEKIVDCRNALGEGPLWDVDEQRLYWVDSTGRALFSCDAAGGDTKEWSLPEPIGSLALRAGGGAVLALKTGFHLFDFASGETELVAATPSEHESVRLNDGKVDRQGRFVAGAIEDNLRKPLCTLYRLDTDFSLAELDREIICSNGPCFSPDGATLYFSDTPRRIIHAYDYDVRTGTASNRRTFRDTQDLPGAPDGCTVDAEGYVWSCAVLAGRLHRFAPDGALDRTVEVPVKTTTSIMLGGPDLDILYLTSAGKAVGGREPSEADAGALFAVHGLGIRGIVEPRFAG